jgi:hypothetical protein
VIETCLTEGESSTKRRNTIEPYTETEEPKYQPFDPSVIKSGGGSNFDDYEQLPAEEPIQAVVADIKMKPDYNSYKSVDEMAIYTWFEVTEGPGKGQRYRYKCSASLADKPKKSNLYKMLEAITGDPKNGIPVNDGQPAILGYPCRIELSEPWSDKQLQFVNGIKKPLASQKKVPMGEVAKEVAAEDSLMETVESVFDGTEEAK